MSLGFVVLLSEAGKDLDIMKLKSRLCWLGESYRLYLHDTAEITNTMHGDALQKASQRVMALLGANKDATIY